MNNWEIASSVYAALATLTLAPVIHVFLKKETPVPVPPDIEKSPLFSPEARLRILKHYERISGTLGFWRNEALKYKYLSTYTTLWVIPSTIAIPVLTQINSQNGATLLITLISSHSAIFISLSKALKTEANFRSNRMGESAFYDLYRRLMDAPQTIGKTEEEQLERYFLAVEEIRQKARTDEVLNNRPEISKAQ